MLNIIIDVSYFVVLHVYFFLRCVLLFLVLTLVPYAFPTYCTVWHLEKKSNFVLVVCVLLQVPGAQAVQEMFQSQASVNLVSTLQI